MCPTQLCEGCSLAKMSDRGGILADGAPGGLLVVTPPPLVIDARAGKPLWGRVGRDTRVIIEEHWKGPVRYVPSVRCVPPAKQRPNGPNVREVRACRTRLAWDIEAGATRILALGKTAVRSITGRLVHVGGLEGSWAYLDGASGPPVAYAADPNRARRSKFAWARFGCALEKALTSDPPAPPPEDNEVLCVESEGGAQYAAAWLRAAGLVTFDVETIGGLHGVAFDIISLAACGEDQVAWVWDEAALADPATAGPLREMLADPTVPKCAQNAKYDILSCEQALGVVTRGLAFDPRLARRLLDGDAPADLGNMNEMVGMGEAKGPAHAVVARACKALAAAAHERTGVKTPANEFKAHAYEALGDDLLVSYNARDVVSTSRIARVLKEELDRIPYLKRTWERTVMPAAETLVRIESTGFPVDRPALVMFGNELRTRIPPVKARLDEIAPGVDLGSAPQLTALLYGADGFGAAVKRRTKTGAPSSDAEALAAMAMGSGKAASFASDLLEWRSLTKMLTTYVDGIIARSEATGRIHPTIDPAGAGSGRLSCSAPNLMNIPVRSELGLRFRRVFRAPAGGYLLEADYSQLEMRVAAALSGDPVLLDVFRRGEDPHMETARAVSQIAWGIPPEAVTREHRQRAKAIVFGALYDKSSYGFSKDFKCSVKEAERLMDLVLGRYKVLKVWALEQHVLIQRRGYTQMFWDGEPARRRLMPNVGLIGDSKEICSQRSGALRSAWNTIIQGSASDVCLSALIEANRWLERTPRLRAKVILTVHDSIMVEGQDQSTLPEVAAGLSEIMADQPLACPLDVECKAGPSWGEMKVIEV